MKAQGTPDQVIYDGRWAKSTVSTIAPPIQLFHPVFESFIRDTQDPHLQPSLKDLGYALELMHSMSRITDEATRASELRTILSKILSLHIRQEPNVDTSSADGIIAIELNGVTYPFSIMELKREAGESNFDPSTQAVLTRTWTQTNAWLFFFILAWVLAHFPCREPLLSRNSAAQLLSYHVWDPGWQCSAASSPISLLYKD